MPFNKKEYDKKYRKQYRLNNREKLKEQAGQYRRDNPEYQRQWRRNNPEKIKKYNEQWRKDNPEYDEQYSENHKVTKAIYDRQYRQTEMGKAVAQRFNTKRRATIKNIINTLTAKEWEDILEEYNYICAYCGVEFNCENLPTKDHVIPISKGGHNIKENIVPACQSCNSKKHNKII